MFCLLTNQVAIVYPIKHWEYVHVTKGQVVIFGFLYIFDLGKTY